MALKKISFIVLLFLFVQNTKATTWKTVNSGNWNFGAVWQGGVAPPFSSADTFLIKHDIIISTDLYFNTNAFLQIDSTGGICGHYSMTVKSGARVIKFGTLDLDTIAIPGGLVDFNKPGAVIITNYGVLSNGGGLNSNGCSVTVGPWFNCQFGDHEGIKVLEKPTVNLYPNPNNGNFYIETNSNTIQTMQLFDVNGRLVLTQTINKKTKIDASNLNEGIYNLSLINNEGVVNKRLLIVR